MLEIFSRNKLSSRSNENDALRLFNKPPKNLSNDMIREWNCAKADVMDLAEYKDKNSYFRYIHGRRSFISALVLLASCGGLSLLSGTGEFPHRQILGMSGAIIGNISALSFTINTKRFIGNVKTNGIEKKRKRHLRKLSARKIKKLHRKWVKSGLISNQDKFETD